MRHSDPALRNRRAATNHEQALRLPRSARSRQITRGTRHRPTPRAGFKSRTKLMVALRSALLLPEIEQPPRRLQPSLRGRAVRSLYEEVPSFVEEQHALFADRRGSACVQGAWGCRWGGWLGRASGAPISRAPLRFAGAARRSRSGDRCVQNPAALARVTGPGYQAVTAADARGGEAAVRRSRTRDRASACSRLRVNDCSVERAAGVATVAVMRR